jgi:phage-related protein
MVATPSSPEPDVWRDVEWLGNSREVVRGWSKAVKCLVGDDLTVVQLGGYPDGCEPLSDVEKDVHAIRIRSGKEQFRVLWIAKLDDDIIYVLHAFHKKSKKGIATPESHKRLARQRLREQRALIARNKLQRGA